MSFDNARDLKFARLRASLERVGSKNNLPGANQADQMLALARDSSRQLLDESELSA